jgi:hypothetical protein
MHEPPMQEAGKLKYGSWLGERLSPKTSPNGSLKTSPVRVARLLDETPARTEERQRRLRSSLVAPFNCAAAPQNALQKLPINVPRSGSSEALHTVTVKDGDEITPRDPLAALAPEFPPPAPRSARRSPAAIEEQPLDSAQHEEIPMEADAVRCSDTLFCLFCCSVISYTDTYSLTRTVCCRHHWLPLLQAPCSGGPPRKRRQRWLQRLLHSRMCPLSLARSVRGR